MRAILRAAAIVLFLTAGFFPRAGAEEIRTKMRQLEDVRSQLDQKKKEVQEYKRQQDQLQRDLDRLKTEKESSERLISELRRKRRKAEERKGELGEKLAALTMAEGKGVRLLSGELSGYARHLGADWAHFGREGLWEEAFRRAAIREKALYLAGLKAFETQTARARTEALNRGKELSEKSQLAQSELKNRLDTYQRKRDDYKETSNRVSRTLREIRDLEESARALTGLIKTLGRKGGLSLGKAATPTTARHSLPWPVSGPLVSRFGKERVPELKTWVIRNGIEIRAPQGTPVLPVEGGRVLFAGPFRSYGNVLIVDHGGAFYTIYGQLREFLAKKGDPVDRGSPIGTVGAPAGQGPGSLYFEIRQGAEALDPLNFLQRP